jgi:excinuclease ABC subunit C
MLVHLKNKIKKTPATPGVYIFKDLNDLILYVGKAKNLKQRLSSYLNIEKSSLKLKKLLEKTNTIDTIILNSEHEALVVENNLIKEHEPFYNVLMRDDKSYPYIKIDIKSLWPRVIKVRKKHNDSALYFGPFVDSSQLNLILQIISELFPIIRCSEKEFNNRTRPCRYYDMRLCLAPCSLQVDNKSYHSIISDIVSALKGNNNNLKKIVTKHMQKAAKDENFEKAAKLRDTLIAFKKHLLSKPNTNYPANKCIDVFACYSNKTTICINIINIKDSLITKQTQFFAHIIEEDTTLPLQTSIVQYYKSTSVPDIIVLPFELKTQKRLNVLLNKKNLEIRTPQRGALKKLLQLSEENAQHNLKEKTDQIINLDSRLLQIKNKLNLKRTPYLIDCIDISNTYETAIVASVIRFSNLKPLKEDYRIYNIITVKNKANDYKSISEVVNRCYHPDKKTRKKPDLVIIDGGLGQLNSAAAALKTIYLKLPFDLISLAKSHLSSIGTPYNLEKIRSKERVFFLNKRQLALQENSLEYKTLTSARNEAHRFALKHHRKKRDKIEDMLTDIKGIGPIINKRLKEKYPDFYTLKSITHEKLIQIKGVTKTIATSIIDKLKNT